MGTLILGNPAALPAQQHGGMMTTPLGIPMDRMGSGTTWIPDAGPIASRHGRLGGWDLTGHGIAFLQYIEQAGPRGDRQLGSLNWAMLMASRPLGGGMLQLRTMLSLDPASVSARGYPSLLQSGELYGGEPIHDRQHPHDFWMELGALYLRSIGPHTGIELYAAASGEPALGPPAFMHRPSAFDDPIAPLGHHWQDATHISFGVATAGLFGRRWKLEGSLFNGREPDEHRWDFDWGPLDSWAGRLTLNPGAAWSLSAGYGRLRQDEGVVRRVSAAVLHGARLGGSGRWATSLVFGANRPEDSTAWARSVLLESEAVFDHANTLFGRIEWVEKSREDLALPPGPRLALGALSLGYLRDVVRAKGWTLGLGLRGAVGLVPAAIGSAYGTRYPRGVTLFLRIRPAGGGNAMDDMPGMRMRH
ncbi:MAG TPA: hypothetical protein VL241_07410 [Gemmatimonadales bacterium]|nr:hypothetical protein [Gemmatimonadales bacterium]